MSEEHTATPRLEAFKDTCGDYEKPHQYINRLHAFAGGLEIECASLKKKADAHDELLATLQKMYTSGHLIAWRHETQADAEIKRNAIAAIRKATGEQQ